MRIKKEQGRSRLHRYYVVEDANHVDSLYGLMPQVTRPLLPCYRDAFAALEAWVDRGAAPPPSHRKMHASALPRSEVACAACAWPTASPAPAAAPASSSSRRVISCFISRRSPGKR